MLTTLGHMLKIGPAAVMCNRAAGRNSLWLQACVRLLQILHQVAEEGFVGGLEWGGKQRAERGWIFDKISGPQDPIPDFLVHLLLPLLV